MSSNYIWFMYYFRKCFLFYKSLFCFKEGVSLSLLGKPLLFGAELVLNAASSQWGWHSHFPRVLFHLTGNCRVLGSLQRPSQQSIVCLFLISLHVGAKRSPAASLYLRSVHMEGRDFLSQLTSGDAGGEETSGTRTQL